ncbi:hypothetical protein Tco_0180965 [Tanacetum coccineum]
MFDVFQETVDVSEESEPKPAKKKTGSGSSRGVVIQDTPSAAKPKPFASKIKLKGIPSLTPEEQEAVNTMKALKESKKTNRRQPGTRGLSEGTQNESENYDDSQLNFDDEEKKDKDGDADEEGNDHISDTQDTDDEDAKTEYDEYEIYKFKIRVRKDVDVEMAEPETGDDENAENDAGSNYQVKESTEFPLPSSSLSVSSGFETPHIQSLSVQKVPISVIPETTNLPPTHEIFTKTPASTIISPPQVTPTILIMQQTTTLIPTPPITTESPTITTVVLESDTLTAVQLRVAKLEKDVSEMKNINLSSEALTTLKSQVLNIPTLELRKIQTPTVNLEQGSEKSASEILKIKREQDEKQKMPKYTIKSTDKAALKEYD